MPNSSAVARARSALRAPSEEHLLPLMVAAGAAGKSVGQRTFSGRTLGWQYPGFASATRGQPHM